MSLSTCPSMLARRMLTPKPPVPCPPRVPRRLPTRKRMTIAIGLMAQEGLVIAADTQEGTGYAGGLKADQPKVMTFVHPHVKNERCACAISGAGDAGYIDALAQNIGQIFMDVRSGH